MAPCNLLLLLLVLLSFTCKTANASLIRGGGSMILQCSDPVHRCGLLSVSLHKYVDDECVESCTMFPMLKVGVECGPCPENSTNTNTTTGSASNTTTPSVSSGPSNGPPLVAPPQQETNGSLNNSTKNAAPIPSTTVRISTPPSGHPSAAPSTGNFFLSVPAQTNLSPTTPTNAPSRRRTSQPRRSPSLQPSKLPTSKNPTTNPPTAVKIPMTSALPTSTPVSLVTSTSAAPVVVGANPSNSGVRSDTGGDDGDDGSGYTIQLQLVDIPQSDQDYFVQAKRRWESIIIGDVKDFTRVDTLSPSSMAHGDCVFPTTGIDDVYICASYKAIDGPKNIVGLAGPIYNRSVKNNGTPVVGEMEFDIDDIDFLKSASRDETASNLVHTVLHEMGHVLGFGTNWDDTGLVVGDESSGDCPYTGSNANREFQAVLNGCQQRDNAMEDNESIVPTEQSSDSGACSHWSEDCFVNELMTGTLEPGTSPLLSRITIASMQDLGYTVNYSQADPYTHANLGSECSCSRRHNRRIRTLENGETLELASAATSFAPSDSQVSRRRGLSEIGHRSAMEFGRSVLEQRRLAYLSQQSSQDRKLGRRPTSLEMDNDQEEESIYVGDQVLSVLIREGDGVYGVVVRR